jgi:hypothetical protein
MSRTAIVYADVQDGYIYGRNAVYATARSTSAGFDTGGDEVFVGRSIDAGDYVNWRGFLLFDLSQLPSAAIKHITQVRLALLASHKEEVGTARPLILLETYNWAYPIAAGNREASYDALTQEGGSGSGDYFEYMVGSNADLANWVVGQWYFYTFEATFLPYLDTLGSGLLRLGMIHESDWAPAGAAPTGNELLGFYSADYGTPYLELTYDYPHKPPILLAPSGKPQLYVYDKEGQLIGDPLEITGRATGRKYSSAVPGGFEQHTFDLPVALSKEIPQHEAHTLVERIGMQTVWQGRIGNIERRSSEGGSRNVVSYGPWEYLKQIRTTEVIGTGETARDCLVRILPGAIVVSHNYEDIGDPNYDLATLDWTRADFQTIINDLMGRGDDQVPPTDWFFNLWEMETAIAVGEIDTAILTGIDDGYDTESGPIGPGPKWDWDGTAVWVGRDTTYLRFYDKLLFRGLNIPRYATIAVATLQVCSAGSVGGSNADMDVYCEDSANPSDVSLTKPSECVPTTASVAWNPAWPGAGTWLGPADLSACFQEVVNRVDWIPGGDIAVLIFSRTGAGDSRQMFYSYEWGSSKQATLHLEFSPGSQVTGYHPEFAPRPEMVLANVDYVISAADTEGGVTLTPSLDELFNRVTAKYGGTSYTTEAMNTASVQEYGSRQNDPASLDAGDNATVAQAENVRDAFLQLHAWPRWVAGDISTKRIYDRYGNRVHPGGVRAGSVLLITDLAMYEPGPALIVFIIRAEYDVDAGVLSLSTETQPDTMDIMLSRLTNVG